MCTYRIAALVLLSAHVGLAVGSGDSGADGDPVCDSGVGGAWTRDVAGGLVSWAAVPPCRWLVGSRADVAARFGGARFLIVGDSVTRNMFYDTCMWLSGCSEPRELDADAVVCNELDGSRFRSAPRVVELPRVGVTLELRIATHVHSLVTALPAILDNPADIVVLSVGFWHLRHPLREPGQYDGAVNATARLLELLASLAPAADARRTVIWRSMTQVETADPGFNPAAVAAMNSAVDAAWRAAGRVVVNLEHLGLCPPPGGACGLTWEGYHPVPRVTVQMAREVLSALARGNAWTGRLHPASGTGAAVAPGSAPGPPSPTKEAAAPAPASPTPPPAAQPSQLPPGPSRTRRVVAPPAPAALLPETAVAPALRGHTVAGSATPSRRAEAVSGGGAGGFGGLMLLAAAGAAVAYGMHRAMR